MTGPHAEVADGAALPFALEAADGADAELPELTVPGAREHALLPTGDEGEALRGALGALQVAAPGAEEPAGGSVDRAQVVVAAGAVLGQTAPLGLGVTGGPLEAAALADQVEGAVQPRGVQDGAHLAAGALGEGEGAPTTALI